MDRGVARWSVSLIAMIGLVAATIAAATIWLLLTDPVRGADSVSSAVAGDPTPFVRAIGSVILGALEAWENIQLVRAEKGGRDSLFYDLSAMSEGYDLDHVVGSMGAGRLLFGSGGGDGVAATLGVLERSTIASEAKDAILRRNAAGLFDLAGVRP